MFVLDAEERRHWLKVFVLVFGRNAFLPDPADEQTFHRRAIDEGRFHQQRVSASLSEVVFGEVFPSLAGAIAEAAPDAPLKEVREAALILLYRLLFILYAEDRDLLPVRDTRYDDYGVRDKVRGDVGRRKDKADVFSSTASRYWSAFDDLCRAIDVGDTSIGLPPYNGGLFDRQRTPLLCTIRLGDAVMADVIDALSFEQVREGRRYINYRDLGVQQLGSIYERLLEQELVRDGETLAVRPNIFARKNTGSYYTPDDLVGLIVRETIDPLIQFRLDAFTAEATDLASSPLPEDRKDRTAEASRPGRENSGTQGLRSGDGLGPFPGQPGRLPFRPRHCRHGRGGSGLGGVSVAVKRAHRQHPQHDHRQCGDARLDGRSRATGRPAHRFGAWC